MCHLHAASSSPALSPGHGRAHLTKVEARKRKAQVGRVDYALDLDLRAKSPTYRGKVTVDFDLVGAAEGLFLDFQGKRLLSATVNGEEAVLEIRKFRVALPGAALVKGRNTVVIEFENPFDKDGSGLHKATDPADGLEYVFSDCEPFNANRFFPCFDQPDLKATYAVTVTAPSDWVVVANGVETAREDADEGRARHRFARTARFSTYVIAVCAGPYKVFEDPQARIPSRILVRQSMAAYADQDEVFELTRQGFDFFEAYFGIPYPYGKYDQVFVPDYNMGAMENVACVVHSDRLLFRHAATERERRNRAVTVLHEMAHMWFGDLVTMEWWDDLWLNESFATYLATLAMVKATRFTDGFEAFRQEEKRWAYWQDELPTTHPIATEVADTVDAFTNFDGITYGKGASVLKQLSFYVGEGAFRAGVAAYLRANAHGNARLADFLAAIGEAAGKDLGEWSQTWLRTSGVNGLVPHVRVEDGKVREVRFTQTPGNGDGVLRPHRVKVAAFALGPGGDPFLSRTADVTVEGAEGRADGLVGVESPAFLLVNHEDHAYAKAYLDPASLRYATENLERLPTSFLRTEVWSTVYMDGPRRPGRAHGLRRPLPREGRPRDERQAPLRAPPQRPLGARPLPHRRAARAGGRGGARARRAAPAARPRRDRPPEGLVRRHVVDVGDAGGPRPAARVPRRQGERRRPRARPRAPLGPRDAPVGLRAPEGGGGPRAREALRPQRARRAGGLPRPRGVARRGVEVRGLGPVQGRRGRPPRPAP